MAVSIRNVIIDGVVTKKPQEIAAAKKSLVMQMQQLSEKGKALITPKVKTNRPDVQVDLYASKVPINEPRYIHLPQRTEIQFRDLDVIG